MLGLSSLNGDDSTGIGHTPSTTSGTSGVSTISGGSGNGSKNSNRSMVGSKYQNTAKEGEDVWNKYLTYANEEKGATNLRYLSILLSLPSF